MNKLTHLYPTLLVLFIKMRLCCVAGHPAAVAAPAAGFNAGSPSPVSCPVPPVTASTGTAATAGWGKNYMEFIWESTLTVSLGIKWWSRLGNVSYFQITAKFSVNHPSCFHLLMSSSTQELINPNFGREVGIFGLLRVWFLFTGLLSTPNLIQLPQQSPGGLLTSPPRLGLQAQVGNLCVCRCEWERENQNMQMT